MNSSVDEAGFIEATNRFNESVTCMNSVTSVASGISIPGEYPYSSGLTSAINTINTSIKTEVETCITEFKSLGVQVAALIELDKKTAEDAENLPQPEIITDSKGKAIGIKTADGIISLDSFEVFDSEKGTYYQWPKGEDSSGLANPCNIYVPKVEKLQGALIYYSAWVMEGKMGSDANIRNFKNGKTDTTGIVIIPTNYIGDKSFSVEKSISYANDAQNIAKSFGIDPKNINLYGWSQAGDLIGNLVKNNPAGTFKTAIFSSSRYGISDVTDPNVKVISILGEGEQGNENGGFVKAAIEEYKATHINEVELYVIPSSSEFDRVGHFNITGAAADSTIFNGQGIFMYGNSASV